MLNPGRAAVPDPRVHAVGTAASGFWSARTRVTLNDETPLPPLASSLAWRVNAGELLSRLVWSRDGREQWMWAG